MKTILLVITILFSTNVGAFDDVDSSNLKDMYTETTYCLPYALAPARILKDIFSLKTIRYECSEYNCEKPITKIIDAAIEEFTQVVDAKNMCDRVVLQHQYFEANGHLDTDLQPYINKYANH